MIRFSYAWNNINNEVVAVLFLALLPGGASPFAFRNSFYSVNLLISLSQKYCCYKWQTLYLGEK
jgi:hypothetical protein